MTVFVAGQKVRDKSTGRVMTALCVLDESNAAITNNQPGDVRCRWALDPAGLEARERTFSPDEIESAE